MKMKSKAELSRMKRSKAYRDYLRGSSNYIDGTGGDAWADYLYEERRKDFYDAGDPDIGRVGYEEGENS